MINNLLEMRRQQFSRLSGDRNIETETTSFSFSATLLVCYYC